MKSEIGAEDVLQQALLQAWVALGRGEQIRDVRAWLYRIVHNVAISQLRRGIRPAAVELDLIEGSGGVDGEVEQRIEARTALAGLAALPRMQREVMLATALEGRSHDELASELGVSSGAVRGLIYRARAALRAAAAALVPAPLLNWAAREDLRGAAASSRVAEAIAGGGSAGIGGLLLKGGAIVVSAGALVGASSGSSAHHRHPTPRPLTRSTIRTGSGQARSRDIGPAKVPAEGRVLLLASVGKRHRPVRPVSPGAGSGPSPIADGRGSGERGGLRSGSDDGSGSTEPGSHRGHDSGSGGGSSGASRDGTEGSGSGDGRSVTGGSRDGGSGSSSGEGGSDPSGSSGSGSAGRGDVTVADSSNHDGGGSSDGGLTQTSGSPDASGGSSGSSDGPTGH